MKIEPLIEALRRDPAANLGRTARTLGHHLPDSSGAELGEFRERLEAVLPAERGFERGYLEALLELSAAFEREVTKQELIEGHLQALATTSARRNVLRELAMGPALVGQLALRLDRTEGAVSKLLASMRGEGLVDVTSTDADARKRIHRLTNLGRKVVRRLRAPAPTKDGRSEEASEAPEQPAAPTRRKRKSKQSAGHAAALAT